MEQTRNRKGYIVNAQGRECSTCKVFKFWEFFGKNKLGQKGCEPECKECAKKRQDKVRSEKRNCPQRAKLFRSIKREYVRGDERADGRVFYCYALLGPIENNFEIWIKKETFKKENKRKAKYSEDRAVRFSKIKRKHKRGYIREDGLIFWRYSCTYEANNFEKWVTDAEFDRLKFNTTKKSYMNKSLGKFGGKDEPTDEIVGLNNHDLSCYIESLFEEGMTWKNRGNWEGKWNPKKPKWHLEHIIPLDAANTLEETKHLWHYTNLRPMWGNENLSKSNKHCRKEFTAFLAERRAADE